MATLELMKGGSRAPTAVAVFIHGLKGDPIKTWQNSSDDDGFWPQWLLADISGLRTITIGYETSATEWLSSSMPLTDRAANIAALLVADKLLLENPIIFVTHSLGGLLLKQIVRHLEGLQSSDNNAKILIENIKLVIFMGTPHFGSRLATVGGKFAAIFRPSSLSKSLIYEDHNLRDLNAWYRRFMNGRIKHVIMSETQGSAIFGKVVDQVSSDPGISDAILIPIDADHSSICKPSDRSNEVYKIIKSEIEAIVASRIEIFKRVNVSEERRKDAPEIKTPKEILHDRLSKHKIELEVTVKIEQFTILLCGPSSSAAGETAGSKLRDRLKTLFHDDGFNVVIGEEDGVSNEHFSRHGNAIIGEFEFIKSTCNAVVIIADTIGTWCELGLFGWQIAKDASIRKRGIDLIVLVSEEYSKGNDFFRSGPFALANALGRAEFVSMDSFEADDLLERLRSRRLIFSAKPRRKSRAVS